VISYEHVARFARCWPLRGCWPEDGLLAAFGDCWRFALHLSNPARQLDSTSTRVT
jgi:hypothetical protein